jgi:hypothetical protein
MIDLQLQTNLLWLYVFFLIFVYSLPLFFEKIYKNII